MHMHCKDNPTNKNHSDTLWSIIIINNNEEIVIIKFDHSIKKTKKNKTTMVVYYVHLVLKFNFEKQSPHMRTFLFILNLSISLSNPLHLKKCI